LVPFWAKDLKIGSKMINAQSETCATKPAFRHAFKTRRCLVVLVGSLFGTVFGFWLSAPRPQRGLVTGEWLPR
jgi:hypothetical protein